LINRARQVFKPQRDPAIRVHMVTWIKGVVAIVFLVFLLYKLISRLVSGLEGELLWIDVVKSAILLCWPLAVANSL